MHHEDKAGVNAFIRGIDRIANAKLPAAVLMCTNRISALDRLIALDGKQKGHCCCRTVS